MSRTYIELTCGCLVSCESGGGHIPCLGGGLLPWVISKQETSCKFSEWAKKHLLCPWCGNCLSCFDHSGCEEDFMAMVQKEEVNV